MRKILCALGLALCSLNAVAGDIYVGKNGLVADALKQAREWRRLNSPEVAGGIRIHLADTVYPLQKPLFIRPEDSGTKDSPTIIMGGTLSGGIAVTGWKREGKLWVAEPPFDGNRIVYTRQLWVNGRKAQLARGPFVRLSGFDKESKTITLPVSLPTGEGSNCFCSSVGPLPSSVSSLLQQKTDRPFFLSMNPRMNWSSRIPGRSRSSTARKAAVPPSCRTAASCSMSQASSGRNTPVAAFIITPVPKTWQPSGVMRSYRIYPRS